MIDLKKGDCLELMKDIPDGSIDAIITDPPYGTTECKWDSVIPFDTMWEQLNRVIKNNGAIVLFGSEPFSSALRMSNIKDYRYDWVWEKSRPSKFHSAKHRPLDTFELISVFSMSNVSHNAKNKMCYYPQKIKSKIINKPKRAINYTSQFKPNRKARADISAKDYNPSERYPKNIIKVNNTERGIHPTQKPVALIEYLIKTYTLENETILDFTMGSGTAGVACKNLNRHFIGIEKDDKYFEIAKDRIENHTPQMEMTL